MEIKTSRNIINWWERKRKYYNVFLIISFILIIGIEGEIILSHKFKFSNVILLAIYLALGNVSYYLGAGFELTMKKYNIHISKSRWLFLFLGFFISFLQIVILEHNDNGILYMEANFYDENKMQRLQLFYDGTYIYREPYLSNTHEQKNYYGSYSIEHNKLILYTNNELDSIAIVETKMDDTSDTLNIFIAPDFKKERYRFRALIKSGLSEIELDTLNNIIVKSKYLNKKDSSKAKQFALQIFNGGFSGYYDDVSKYSSISLSFHEKYIDYSFYYGFSFGDFIIYEFENDILKSESCRNEIFHHQLEKGN